MTVRNSGGDPATNHYEVTKSNTANLSPTPRAIMAVGDGTLTIADQGNMTITYTVTSGQILPFRALRIHTDSTSNAIAWY